MRLGLLILLSTSSVFGALVTDEGQGFEFGISISGRSAGIIASSNIVHISQNSGWTLALKGDGSLLAWGTNGEGQTNTPAGTDFVHCYAGWTHGIACKADGSVVEWGTPFLSVPLATWEAKRPAGLASANIVQVSAGDNHSLALDDTGKIWAWGGTASVTNKNNLITNAYQILSTWYNCAALLTNGSPTGTNSMTITNWGHLGFPGQYLHATNSGGYITNAKAFGCSQFAWYAILTNGNSHFWGMTNMASGQHIPPANATNLVSISGGYRNTSGVGHTIAARADGTVLAWGDNTWGQTTLPANLTNSLFVSAGRFLSSAIAAGTNQPPPPDPPTGLTINATVMNATTVNAGTVQ